MDHMIFISMDADSYALALQTHILSLDTLADRGGQAAEGAILGALASRFKVPIAEFVDRRSKSKLGLGGVALGYAVAWGVMMLFPH